MAGVLEEHRRRRDEDLPPGVVPGKVWLVLLAIGVVAALVASVLHYSSGGGHVQLGAGYSAGPLQVGDEYHLLIPVLVTGDDVELRSVDVASSGPATVTVRLVRVSDGAADGGTLSGPLGAGYQVVQVRGQRVFHGGSPQERASYSLDVRVTSNETGATGIDRVALTYQAGRFRRRTVAAINPLCLRAVPDIATEVTRPATEPPGPDNDPCDGEPIE